MMGVCVKKLAPFVLGAMVIGACSQQGPGTPTVLESRAQPYVPDVPVPARFERDERNSSYTSAAGFRTVRDVYRGKDSPLAARNFYVHYMPMADWEMIDDKLQNSVYLLNFRKGQESCEIRIERTPSGVFGAATQIRATIEPTTTKAPAEIR